MELRTRCGLTLVALIAFNNAARAAEPTGADAFELNASAGWGSSHRCAFGWSPAGVVPIPSPRIRQHGLEWLPPAAIEFRSGRRLVRLWLPRANLPLGLVWGGARIIRASFGTRLLRRLLPLGTSARVLRKVWSGELGARS